MMAYDGAGSITSKTYQDATTQLRVDFTHDLAGNVMSETRYKDVAGTQLAGTTQYGYDAGQVTSIVQKDAAGSLLASYQYTYDKAGRVVLENDDGNITKYLYDAKGQLTQANGEKYKWDPNGNPSGPGYVIGPNNELFSDGTWNYTYDAVGNQTGKTNIATGVNWSYSYDNANHLLSAVESGANGKIIQSVSYNYDAFGNRIGETVTARKKTTNDQMSYDASGNLYADLAKGGVATRYLTAITGPDTWLARVTSGVGAAWLLTDHLGSVRTVVDLSGKILDQIDYDPFGAITSETHPSQGGRLKFDGGQEDLPTGELYFVDRNYDLATRRWTTPDPTGLTFDVNPYRFVNNAPTNGTDATGDYMVVQKGTEGKWLQELKGMGLTVDAGELPARWFRSARVVLWSPDITRLQQLQKSAADDWTRNVAHALLSVGYSVEGDAGLGILETELSTEEQSQAAEWIGTWRAERRGTSFTPSTPERGVLREGIQGANEGAKIGADTFTFGQIESLHKDVEQLIQENGGAYRQAQVAAVVARESLIAAGTLGLGSGLNAGVNALKATGYVRTVAGITTAAEVAQPLFAYWQIKGVVAGIQGTIAALQQGDLASTIENGATAGFRSIGLVANVKATRCIGARCVKTCRFLGDFHSLPPMNGYSWFWCESLCSIRAVDDQLIYPKFSGQ